MKIVCALPGLTTGYGPSHQATEDLAIFRGHAEHHHHRPCDAHEIEQAAPAIAAHDGPVYMRLLRGNVPVPCSTSTTTASSWARRSCCATGADALVISSGFMTMRALEAAELPRTPTASASAVLHVPTIKPLDDGPSSAKAAKQRRAWSIVAENHSMVGGLGEAVAGLLMRAGIRPPAFRQIALARRLPGCRSPADPARALRHLGGSGGGLGEELARAG